MFGGVDVHKDEMFECVLAKYRCLSDINAYSNGIRALYKGHVANPRKESFNGWENNYQSNLLSEHTELFY